VQVRPTDSNGADAPLALGPNDQYSSRLGGTRVLTAKQLEDALAWRQGKIVFERHDAGAKRPRGLRIIMAKPSTSLLPWLANRSARSYSIDDLGGFLARLEQMLPHVKTNTDYQNGAVSITVRD
jgi:hypothetical protein